MRHTARWGSEFRHPIRDSRARVALTQWFPNNHANCCTVTWYGPLTQIVSHMRVAVKITCLRHVMNALSILERVRSAPSAGVSSLMEFGCAISKVVPKRTVFPASPTVKVWFPSFCPLFHPQWKQLHGSDLLQPPHHATCHTPTHVCTFSTGFFFVSSVALFDPCKFVPRIWNIFASDAMHHSNQKNLLFVLTVSSLLAPEHFSRL